ncbi:MAG: SDR family NAD(P)-dependent oxidoreductase [Pseudomonadota bacterium]
MHSQRFQSKVAIVTGASMGIGRATARQLSREGALVVGCARRKPNLDSLAREVDSEGGRFIGVELDVGDTDAFASLIEQVAAEHLSLDVLINNAPSVIGGAVLDQSLEDWRANFGVGVDSVFIGVQAALRIMIPKRSGAIVNVSSVSGLRAGVAAGAYGGAKAALNQFSQCAAMEAAPHNVRINVVAPGAVETPGLDAATGKSKAVKDIIVQAIPMQRAARAEEVAEAICFLASEDASFITGTILPVDGGKTPQLYVPAFDITNLNNQSDIG